MMVALFQFLSSPLLFFGWIWANYWSYLMIDKSMNPKKYIDSRAITAQQFYPGGQVPGANAFSGGSQFMSGSPNNMMG